MASLAHPAVDVGEAMTATTPIDAASRPRRSPTTRLRHSRESLSWPPATVDKIALSCLSFSLLERGKPIAERACCTVTVVVGTDASGAAAVKAATPAAPRNPTYVARWSEGSGFLVDRPLFRSHEHQAGRTGAWETLIACTSLEQGTTAARDGARGPEATAARYVRWLLFFVRTRPPAGIIGRRF